MQRGLTVIFFANFFLRQKASRMPERNTETDPGPVPNPDPLVRGMDPRIQIRIHTKISWIRNTGRSEPASTIKSAYEPASHNKTDNDIPPLKKTTARAHPRNNAYLTFRRCCYRTVGYRCTGDRKRQLLPVPSKLMHPTQYRSFVNILKTDTGNIP